MKISLRRKASKRLCFRAVAQRLKIGGRKMSRLLSEEEYRHTRAFKIKRWYHGEKDPYIGSVEMKPQKPFKEDIAVQKKAHT